MDFGLTVMDSAVFQRMSDNLSEHIFKGTCRSNGRVMMTATAKDGILNGFNQIQVGNAARGKFNGVIKGLPVGGPYTLAFSIENSREKAVFKNIQVGDLWLLAGQSNMADSAFMPSLAESDEHVNCFYMNNSWGMAVEPLHDVARAVAPAHGGDPRAPKPKKFLRGAGPGLPFGVEMYKATGVPQGLIACAHGGTSMSQWDPDKKSQGDYSLYGALYNRLQNLGGKVAGVLWYQGCNEVGSDDTVDSYEQNMIKLFKAFRRDCKNPQLPIVFAQLASYIFMTGELKECPRRWLKMRDTQFRLAKKIKNTVCVPTIDLELDDQIHLSNAAVVTLGKRMAEAMLGLRGDKTPVPQISPRKAICRENPITNCADVEILFDNVQGKLESVGPACGFCVVDKDGNFVAEAVRVFLHGSKVVVRTRILYALFASSFKIAYGGAFQPHANIIDEANRSLPCFIMAVADGCKNISPILNEALVSEAVPGDDTFDKLAVPANFDNVKFAPAPFNVFYLPAPRSAGDWDATPRVYYYKFKLNAAEDMDLVMLFGADAPFVLCCDGVEFARIHTGNPVNIDEFKIPLKLQAGTHEFLCVFSANGGRGYGICCRFKRKDGSVMPTYVKAEDLQA